MHYLDCVYRRSDRPLSFRLTKVSASRTLLSFEFLILHLFRCLDSRGESAMTAALGFLAALTLIVYCIWDLDRRKEKLKGLA